MLRTGEKIVENLILLFVAYFLLLLLLLLCVCVFECIKSKNISLGMRIVENRIFRIEKRWNKINNERRVLMYNLMLL